jgi:excisionase family DNA binding protein
LSVSPIARRRGSSRVPSLALSKTEAAQALGLSLDTFNEYVYPELRVVRRTGRRILIPVRELEAWLDRNAARTLEGAT